MLWFRSSGQLPAFDSHELIEGHTAATLMPAGTHPGSGRFPRTCALSEAFKAFLQCDF
jgi:hypothetical protein